MSRNEWVILGKVLKCKPRIYITEKHMQTGKLDLEKKLIGIRWKIDLYEARRQKLSGMSGLEEQWEDANKRLQELWAEFRKIYFRLRNKY